MERGERRKRHEWEAQYVSEYVARRYPGVPVRIHAHLGTQPRGANGQYLEPAEERMLRVYMRWADAIVFSPSETVVIEGKLRTAEYAKALGELEIYVALVPHTAEYAHLVADRVVGEILVPIPDPTVEMLARRKGFRMVVWAPSWFSAYFGSIEYRSSRAVRPEEAPLL